MRNHEKFHIGLIFVLLHFLSYNLTTSLTPFTVLIFFIKEVS